MQQTRQSRCEVATVRTSCGLVSYQDSRQRLPDEKKVTCHQGQCGQETQGGDGHHPGEQRACTHQIMGDQYWTSSEEPSIKAAQQIPGAWPPGATPHTGVPYPDVLCTRLSAKRTETQYSRPGLRLSRTSLLRNLAFWKQMKEASSHCGQKKKQQLNGLLLIQNLRPLHTVGLDPQTVLQRPVDVL